jgi:hypothetical protein
VPPTALAPPSSLPRAPRSTPSWPRPSPPPPGACPPTSTPTTWPPPTGSRIWSMNCESLDSLKVSVRCGLSRNAFLVRNLRRERLLVVVTYRDDEPGQQRLGPYLAELDRGGPVQRLELPAWTGPRRPPNSPQSWAPPRPSAWSMACSPARKAIHSSPRSCCYERSTGGSNVAAVLRPRRWPGTRNGAAMRATAIRAGRQAGASPAASRLALDFRIVRRLALRLDRPGIAAPSAPRASGDPAGQ